MKICLPLPFFLFVLLTAVQLSAQSFSPQSIQKTIIYLASDELQGRKSGTTGDSLAACYIRDQFRDAGAQLLGNEGIQYFNIVADITSGKFNLFSVSDKPYLPEKDFIPLSFSSNDSLSASVIFAGFGIVGNSGELAWDDYNRKDVRNKWVMVLRGDPEPENTNSAFIPMSTERAKALTARDRGAGGLLIVSPSAFEKQDKPLAITFDKTVSDAGIPVISITRKLAAEILQMPVSAIDSIEKLMTSSKKQPDILIEKIVNARTDVVRNKVTTRNIIALLTGNNKTLSDEYIVIGAHYDHLGLGGQGSGSRVPGEQAVHGGADDNASGVAALIELVNYFSKPENRPARSLLFVSFGSEEMGILGSKYFVAHAPVDLKKIRAMVNLDMVGRLNPESNALSISGTGTFLQADSLLGVLAKNTKLDIKKSPDGYGPSDHASFYGEGIPVLFLTTGAHDDYHTPSDVASHINYEGEAEVLGLTSRLIASLADLVPAPVFKESGSRRESGNSGRNLKVTLGIMPDVSGAETSGGMKVEGTRIDGPAQKAGMVKVILLRPLTECRFLTFTIT